MVFAVGLAILHRNVNRRVASLDASHAKVRNGGGRSGAIGALAAAGSRVDQALIGQLARYAIAGVANTTVALGCVLAGKAVLGLPDLVANALGYTIGITQSYSLSRSFIFRHTGSFQSSLWRFLSVVAAGYLLNVGVLFAAVKRLGVNAYLAQVLGMAAYAIFVFVASRRFAFDPLKQRE